MPVMYNTEANTPTQHQVQKPTVLCILDHILGNLIIHYSRTRVLHPRQGVEDVLEVIREENLLADGIKLVYLLAGRPDISLSPGTFGRNVEKLLDGMARIVPRIMIVIGAVLVDPSDGSQMLDNIREMNARLSRIAEGDHHWLYFNTNLSISVAGQPQKRFFDKLGKVNKNGCRFIAQGLVASSKAVRMLQNFTSLPPKNV